LGKLALDPKLRELCLLHAVKLVGGDYEWVQHVPIARDLGCSDAQIAALDGADDGAACFCAGAKAALRFTREVVVAGRASDATLALLQMPQQAPSAEVAAPAPASSPTTPAGSEPRQTAANLAETVRR